MFQAVEVIFLFLFGFNFCWCFDEAWRSYQIHSKLYNLEELQVKNVTATEAPNIPLNVTKWTTLTLGSVCYTAGYNSTHLILLNSTLHKNSENFHVDSKVVELPSEPVDIIISELNESVIKFTVVVAIKETGEILWYNLNENKDLILFQTWSLHKTITSINFFKIKNKDTLLVASENAKSHEFYLELFQLENSRGSYWLLQSMQFLSPIQTSAFNNIHCNYYLSVPQTSINTLLVYKYEGNRFVTHKNLSIPDIRNVYAFDIGVKSFIAVDGLAPGILQFTDKGLVREKVRNSNLEGINHWMPVPVENYRSDVVLLVQRVLDHNSHHSVVVDIITYNGLSFEEHEDIPCHYFGEDSNSLSCLVQAPENNQSINGATYLSFDGKLALLIPGNKALFLVNSEIKKSINPMKEKVNKLLEKKNKLQEIMDNDEKFIANMQNRLKSNIRRSDETDSNILKSTENEQFNELKQELDSLGSEIDSLKNSISNINKTKDQLLNKIVFNGGVEVKGFAKFEDIKVEQIKYENATKLVSDIAMKDDMKSITANKTFTDIHVNNLNADNINGISMEHLLFKTNGTVIINGDVIIVNGTVDIDNIQADFINDVHINEIVFLNDTFNDTIEFQEISTDHLFAKKINNLDLNRNISTELPRVDHMKTIYVPENLTVTNINGENFNDFLKQICLKNLRCFIPNLTVDGNIVVESDAHTEFLNDLQFPEEYILQDSTLHSNISGRKTFKGSLTARNIRAIGLIDKVNTEEVITLSSDQEIPTTIRFELLEITEQLKVKGNIVGDYIDNFIPNPTLEQINAIHSKVNFKDLEVHGSIIVNNSFNEKSFLNALEDVVYKDEESVTIPSVKQFSEGFSVRNNLQLDSNMINEIPLTSFVSMDSDQVLDINSLNGAVNFDNLHVNGLFGNINISKLDQECVKLTGEQFISSTLIFNDKLKINNLEIEDSLNDLRSDEYLYTEDDLELNNVNTFSNVKAENMFVQGNFHGEILGFDLDKFKSRILSYTKDQNVTAHYIVNHLLTQQLTTNQINGVNLEDLLYHEKVGNKLIEKIQKGATIKNLIVDGHLQLNKMNNKTMKYIEHLINLNVEDLIQKEEVIFENDVYFENLEIDHLSSVDFNNFVSSIVFKNESEVVFDSEKEFTSPLTIEKLLEIDALNNVKIENIFTNQGNQTLTGPITIHGDVLFNSKVEVEKINDFNITYIYDNFDVSNESYVIKGDVIFKRMVDVVELVIKGLANNRSTEEFLNNIVYVNGNYTFNEDILFQQNVEVDGNVVIGNTLNGVDLDSFVPRIVLRTKDATINDLVAFANPVHVQNLLKIEGELISADIFGCSTSDWANRAVFLNKGMLYGNYTFEEIYLHDSLTTDYINDVNMTTVIPLKQNQNQSISFLNFDEVTLINGINVNNLVNGYNLAEEVNNTVMANLEQEITSDIVFTQNILVRENLNTSKINDIDANTIVTTNTDQNLTASYVFQAKVTMDSNLDVWGEVNGINMSQWETNAMKLHSAEMQTIEDVWNVKGNVTFEEGVFGNGLIGGMDLQKVVKDIDDKTKIKYERENGLIVDYNNICRDINFLYKETQKIPYKFEYFEQLQRLEFGNLIQNVHFFKVRHQNYLLVTEKNSCFTHLLFFKFSQFFPLNSFHMGHVSQIITTVDGDFVYLISRSDALPSKCKVEGTNVWRLMENNLEHIASIESQNILQESLVPGTFYGMSEREVSEFKIRFTDAISVNKYRKWRILEDNNWEFVPRGLGTGLAVSNGHTLIKLLRQFNDDDVGLDLNADVTIIGNTTEKWNAYLPGRNGGDAAVLSVGVRDTKRPLLAVAIHEETMKKDRMDFIKIYDNAMTGKMVQKILTYKPTSLIPIDFNNGETLLAFLENGRTMQMYEYRGIEGFIYKVHAPVRGSKLFVMELPIESFINDRKVVGVVNENNVDLLVAVMSGNKIRDDIRCGL